MSEPAEYTFVPWVREGYRPTDGSGEDWSVEVAVTVEGEGSADPTSEDAEVDLSLYGPGEVTGIDRQQVIRTEPTSGTSDFPPNYFPVVEFDEPTLPWLFTPETADDDGKLRPWCCLLTVEQTEGVSISTSAEAPSPVLDIRDPATPGEHLPNLGESWAWAHSQVVGENDEEAALETDRSKKTLSRLISPRNLEAQTAYYACVVPTYEPGRLAGLGKEPYERDDDGNVVRSHGDAWDASNPPGRLRLPVYYHWEFTTGKAGDFESLVRRLEPSVLEDVGVRQVHAGDPGPGVLAESGEEVTVEGALRSANVSPDTYATRLRDELTTILDDSSALAPESAVPREVLEDDSADGPDSEDPGDTTDDRILGPPIYGQWPPAAPAVSADSDPPAWLHDLNADPRYRVPAAFGTEVVQDRQEPLMAEAWRQVGDIREANRLLRHARLSRAASQPIHDAMERVSPAALLSLSEPAHGRLREESGRTVAATVADSALPSAVLSPAFRRATRPGGTLARRLGGLRRERVVEGVADGSIDPGDDGSPAAGTQVIGDGLADQLCEAAQSREDTLANWSLLGPDADAPIGDLVASVGEHCQETRSQAEEAADRLEDQAARSELAAFREVLFPICWQGEGDNDLESLLVELEEGDWAGVRSAVDQLRRWLDEARARHDSLETMAESDPALAAALADSPGVTPAFEALLEAVTLLWVRLIVAGLFARSCEQAADAIGTLRRHFDGDPPAHLIELSALCGTLCGDGQGSGLLGELETATANADTRRVRRIVDAMAGVVAAAEPRLARLDERDVGAVATLEVACESVGWYLAVLRRRLADAPWDPAADALGPRVCPRESPDPAPPLDLRATASAVHDATDPADTIPARIAGRLDGLGLTEREEPLAQIMAHPEFDEPMFGALRDLGQEKLVPGVGEIPLDSVGVLETNPAFVEAYMLGLSHEMARELRWREYPTDLRGTYFRQFWDPEGRDPPLSGEEKKDIEYVHLWEDAEELGGNYLAKMAAKTPEGPGEEAGARVVLVVRGALFDRYPNAHVYAAKGEEASDDPDLARRPKLPNMGTDGGPDVEHPIFRGTLDPDITFFGFDLSEDEVDADPGWFFVIEEPPSGPSFGLDAAEQDDDPGEAATWEDLTWDDVSEDGYVSVAGTTFDDVPSEPAWGKNGAHMGEITWIRPFRAAIHADDMVPTGGDTE